MSEYEIIQYISTPLALIAFCVAIGAKVFQSKLAEKQKLIREAFEKDRGKLIEQLIRDFTIIETNGLTNKQKYDIIMKTIYLKEKKIKMTAIISIVLTFILAFVIIYTNIIDSKSVKQTTNGDVSPAIISEGNVTIEYNNEKK